jgi:hypothetical protein
MPRLGRRSAIKLIGAVPVAAGLGGTTSAQVTHGHTAGAAKAATKAVKYAPKFFNAHEWQTVRVLVDLVIPKDERSGSATDAGVPEFIDFMMTDPAENDRSRETRQTRMRGGLAWLDTECRRRFGQDFVSCSPAQQTALLDDIAYWKGSDEEDDAGDPAQMRADHGPAFFASFRDLTASGFWSSKMGVEDLGYVGNAAFPWSGPPEAVLRKLGLP